MGRNVLVTGAAGPLGGRLLRFLRRDKGVARLIGVDSRAPVSPVPDTEFVRIDLDGPTVVSVLAECAVDTVVHLDLREESGAPAGRVSAREANVLGTMRLLGACQRVPAVRRLVVRSSTRIYGGSAREPAVFGEDSPPRAPSGEGFARDVAEVEEYVRGFARRRPDVSVTVLRFAHLLGPGSAAPLAAYFRLPVLPTVWGYDPRLQLLHEDDALEVVGLASGEPGLGEGGFTVFNVAGEGVVTLSQAARRLGRPTVPLMSPFAPWFGSTLRAMGIAGVSAERFRSLLAGRVVRTARLRAAMGGPLPHSTARTIADFGAVHGPGLLPPETVSQAFDRFEEALRRG
ncbi:NAD-dependent epimerase/dehydratase family protein [Streptomyces sp. NBRC 109706]|uniref:NAD-dependent epimerase/dehydratase family protein n=1 Tax=Streptomyces sp. NBRC 109706 TaxID=1550035 RepID=UPI0007842846|nr:NAD-dependent epimerase/dehydratase family protein [Streptomyces sp. NBRC 109706]